MSDKLFGNLVLTPIMRTLPSLAYNSLEQVVCLVNSGKLEAGL